MKLEENQRKKTIEQLEKNVWPPLDVDEGSYLIKKCHSLRKKAICDFTVEDLRIMVGQEIGLPYLIPEAIEVLTVNLFSEGDFFEGDLLKSVLGIESQFWMENKAYWKQLTLLMANRRDEIAEKDIDTTKFDAIFPQRSLGKDLWDRFL